MRFRVALETMRAAATIGGGSAPVRVDEPTWLGSLTLGLAAMMGVSLGMDGPPERGGSRR